MYIIIVIIIIEALSLSLRLCGGLVDFLSGRFPFSSFVYFLLHYAHEFLIVKVVVTRNIKKKLIIIYI